MSLPVGTVTFLYSDIEGSTSLWEKLPEAMTPALARHDALLRDAVEGNQGVVVKLTGDGMLAVFATAPDALQAALTAQQALHAEPWANYLTEEGVGQSGILPNAFILKSRMALHTGAAEARGGDYYGSAVNRVARLMATAHGGQIVLSTAAQELTRDALPPDVTLLDLGEHQLKDLTRPERVFQLCHPSLPADFGPLRSLDFLPNNLPQQTTSFIGREEQTQKVSALLNRHRLVTLTGSGGCGKTRLSLQVAADALDDFPDGVWFVELAPLTDPNLTAREIAGAIGIREEPGKPLLETLTGRLKTSRLLIVLDNCEHLVAACAQIADALLRACPGVRLLTTSREALNISGEQTYRVPSLTMPPSRTTATVTAMQVSQYEAVRLFIERAMLVRPDFIVTNQNAPAVAQLCHRLDGIPLALELAAARVRALPVEQIMTRLDDRFRLLTGGSRAVLPRQQTLRALVDWSYDLLDDREKTLLHRLAIFSGGWTLEAAEEVCADLGLPQGVSQSIQDWEILDLLTSLSDKSLVVADTHGEGVRYRLLETIQQYAYEHLRESGGEGTARERHLAYFLKMAEEAEPHLMGPEMAIRLSGLEAELDNFRAALDWTQNAERGAQNLRLAAALGRLWEVRGYWREGRERLDTALTFPGEPAVRSVALRAAGLLANGQGDNTAALDYAKAALTASRDGGDRQGEARAYNTLGLIYAALGDYEAAEEQYRESWVLSRKIGDRRNEAYSLNNQGNIVYYRGDHAEARRLYEDALILFRELSERKAEAAALNNLGSVASDQGDFPASRRYYEQALALNRELGDRRNEATALHNMGWMASTQGDFAGARTPYEESLALFRELGDRAGEAHCLYGLGNVVANEMKTGDDPAAQTAKNSFREALTRFQEQGNRMNVAFCLLGLARVRLANAERETAAQLLGAAIALLEESGGATEALERTLWDEAEAHLRRRLGESAFTAAFDAGRSLPAEQALALALS